MKKLPEARDANGKIIQLGARFVSNKGSCGVCWVNSIAYLDKMVLDNAGGWHNWEDIEVLAHVPVANI